MEAHPRPLNENRGSAALVGHVGRGSNELERRPQAYIPIDMATVRERLLDNPRLTAERDQLEQVADMLGAIVHHEWHDESQLLKRAYHPMDPDNLEPNDESMKEAFIETFRRVLEAGDWEEITQAELDEALDGTGVFPINLKVRFDEFERMRLFKLGTEPMEQDRKGFLGIGKKTIQVPSYERVIQLVEFKEEPWFIRNKREKHYPGDAAMGLHLRMFKRVPKYDVETIFPNTAPKMRGIDRIRIGIPLIAGLGSLGAKFWPLILFAATIGAAGAAESTEGNIGLPVLGGVLVALAGYMWKTLRGYRKTREDYLDKVSRDLYFKSIANNSGVIHSVIDLAEEQELKEMLMAYVFMFRHTKNGPEVPFLTVKQLDHAVQTWIQAQQAVEVDFEIDDALEKLDRLGVLRREVGRQGPFVAEEHVTVLEPAMALAWLDHHWDNLYGYSKGAGVAEVAAAASALGAGGHEPPVGAPGGAGDFGATTAAAAMAAPHTNVSMAEAPGLPEAGGGARAGAPQRPPRATPSQGAASPGWQEPTRGPPQMPQGMGQAQAMPPQNNDWRALADQPPQAPPAHGPPQGAPAGAPQDRRRPSGDTQLLGPGHF